MLIQFYLPCLIYSFFIPLFIICITLPGFHHYNIASRGSQLKVGDQYIPLTDTREIYDRAVRREDLFKALVLLCKKNTAHSSYG
jgi:hypothetical protein